jgi:tRNA pseudouridine32 synthase/23S rRNA pseudouridine746 synthase
MIRPEQVAYVRSFLLYEDTQVLAFNKPSGLAVQGGAGVEQSLEDLLAAFAKSNGKRPRLVHRLDRETSGIILAARTKPAAAFLSRAFAERRVKKLYCGIVCGGAPQPEAGTITRGLRKITRGGIDLMELSEAPDAQSAVTHYRTLAAAPHAALLALEPETGRMHQLRAHLAAIGRPIAGDGKYGGLFSLTGVAIPSLMLHAAALSFPHPAGGAHALHAPAPTDFVMTAERLGLPIGGIDGAAGPP